MVNLISIIEEADNEFDDKFVAHLTSSPGNMEHDRAIIFFEDVVKIKSHNKATLIKLVEAIENEVQNAHVYQERYDDNTLDSPKIEKSDILFLLSDLKAKLTNE